MEQSILLSIKKLLGLDRNYNAFDTDVIISINSVLNVLYQIGVGKKPYHITGEIETWSDCLGNRDDMEMIKSFVCLRVRLLFDPPTTGVLHEAMERQASELEWRLNFEAEGGMDLDDGNDGDGDDDVGTLPSRSEGDEVGGSEESSSTGLSGEEIETKSQEVFVGKDSSSEETEREAATGIREAEESK